MKYASKTLACLLLFPLVVPVCAAAASEPRIGSFGLDLDARDLSVRPGDDFWSHANGKWANQTAIPPDVDAVGVAAQQSRDMETVLHGLFEAVARDPHAKGHARLVGDFYASWMDEAALDASGLRPARRYLRMIDEAKDARAIQRLLAAPPFQSLLVLDVVRDPVDPTVNILRIGQGELGMARDYFVLQGSPYQDYRTAYAAYLETLLENAGIPDASARAEKVVALETRLAQGFAQAADKRDGEQGAQRMTRRALQIVIPAIEWKSLLREGGVDRADPILLGDSAGIAGLASALHDTPVAVWRDYLRTRFLSDYADFLPAPFSRARFAFFGQIISGISQPAPRWRRAVNLINERLGDAVSDVYASRHIDPETVGKVRAIYDDVRNAFRWRIEHATWMDEATRRGAIAKVDSLTPRIGAPDGRSDYSGLVLDRRKPLENVIALAQFQNGRRRQALRNPSEKAEWPFRSQDTNGFYYASANSVMLAGGLLNPPFFDAAADPAVNYGAIGAFIGHELGHAFDDQGSQYDASGREIDWWSAASRKAFEARTGALEAQYAQYEALPGLPVDGHLTLGENIADLGGLEAAFDAYHAYQARTGGDTVIAGLTGAQRFFLSNAQMRRTMLREDVQRLLATIDPHSPPRIRVNGAMRNMDGWYAAFSVGPGDRLYLPPKERIHIW